jgi:hyperosmotically inducible protein
MKARGFFAWVLAAACMLPTGAFAQDWRDQRLADEVSRRLTSYPQYTIFDSVGAQVDQAIVTLTGRVTMPYKKNDIGKRIEGIDGVRGLRNNISVLPVSHFDDDLRYRIARAIYGNPSFWTYAAMANPPIHIIVENGHVTLTGVVGSNVERMLARSLATGQGELSVTNDLKTEAEIASRQSLVSGSGLPAQMSSRN